jgi:hypothetical protein
MVTDAELAKLERFAKERALPRHRATRSSSARCGVGSKRLSEALDRSEVVSIVSTRIDSATKRSGFDVTTAYGAPQLTIDNGRPGLTRLAAVLPPGAIGLYKNPSSHRRVDFDDPNAVASLLMFASELIRLVDSCQWGVALGEEK